VCSHARSWINWFTATDGAWRTISATCLERVWRAEEFSNYMTQMLHPTYDDEFENGVQMARLRQAVNSREASTVLARNTLT